MWALCSTLTVMEKQIRNLTFSRNTLIPFTITVTECIPHRHGELYYPCVYILMFHIYTHTCRISIYTLPERIEIILYSYMIYIEISYMSIFYNNTYTYLVVCLVIAQLCPTWSLYCVWLSVTARTTAHQAPLFMESSRKEYWSG